ncbi:MAG: ribonuclease R [Bacteroidota bacterium]
MSKKRKKSKKSNKGDFASKLKTKIVNLLNAKPTLAFSSKQITRKLGFKNRAINREIPIVLATLARDGQIKQVANHVFQSLREPEYVTGRVDHVNARFAYIVTPEEEPDIYVKSRDLNYAFDGDTVKVSLYSTKRGANPEGQVVEIVKRAKESFVGRLEISPKFAFVIPDNRKIHQDIFVKLNNAGGAEHNDKVIVDITVWPDRDRNPEGKVSHVLGKAGENDAEIHSIMAEFGLPFSFPEAVDKAADKIADRITAAEIKKRKDFREITTFTIDPEDAKDFDDALSFRQLENGNYEVGVHIADVSHYVKPDSILEKEAFERATSVYLVDRTIPMLPERLSNGLCSLRPNEDKLTFAALFELDANGRIQSEWFGRTIIHSDRRFTYEEAQERIETQEGDFSEELHQLNQLALKIKADRFKKGAINFETTEVKFKLNEDGKPLGIIPKVRKDAHKLIEEFMLLANKQVANFIYHRSKGKDKDTFVYRTHDYPDPEKVATFANFAKRFGHDLDVEQESISQSLNGLMDEIEGKPEQNILESLAIRAMAKAKYTTQANGHFGLAFKHYTHFTSPIRRYPDVMVHRLLQHYLDGGKSVDKEEYEEKCVHSSEQEKRAADADRASIKYKQVEFMQSVEDKVFEGIISGVTEWGIYVEIVETKCEGMVRMVDLDDDYYEFDEDNYRVIGRRNKKMYTLGDKVHVSVKSTDIDRRTIDLLFEEE